MLKWRSSTPTRTTKNVYPTTETTIQHIAKNGVALPNGHANGRLSQENRIRSTSANGIRRSPLPSRELTNIQDLLRKWTATLNPQHTQPSQPQAPAPIAQQVPTEVKKQPSLRRKLSLPATMKRFAENNPFKRPAAQEQRQSQNQPVEVKQSNIQRSPYQNVPQLRYPSPRVPFFPRYSSLPRQPPPFSRPPAPSNQPPLYFQRPPPPHLAQNEWTNRRNSYLNAVYQNYNSGSYHDLMELGAKTITEEAVTSSPNPARPNQIEVKATTHGPPRSPLHQYMNGPFLGQKLKSTAVQQTQTSPPDVHYNSLPRQYKTPDRHGSGARSLSTSVVKTPMPDRCHRIRQKSDTWDTMTLDRHPQKSATLDRHHQRSSSTLDRHSSKSSSKLAASSLPDLSLKKTRKMEKTSR